MWCRKSRAMPPPNGCESGESSEDVLVSAGVRYEQWDRGIGGEESSTLLSGRGTEEVLRRFRRRRDDTSSRAPRSMPHSIAFNRSTATSKRASWWVASFLVVAEWDDLVEAASARESWRVGLGCSRVQSEGGPVADADATCRRDLRDDLDQLSTEGREGVARVAFPAREPDVVGRRVERELQFQCVGRVAVLEEKELSGVCFKAVDIPGVLSVAESDLRFGGHG